MSTRAAEARFAEARVTEARAIDTIVLELNRSTKLCFAVVQVLQDTPTYVDAFVFESKFQYTQALRLLKRASDGGLDRAVCINFKPDARFELPSFADAIGIASKALTTPDLVDRRRLNRGERLEPVEADTDFGYAPVEDGLRQYVPLHRIVRANHTVYERAFANSSLK